MQRCVTMCLSAILGLCATANAAIINVPADHPTLQGAINAAVDGDEIIVQPGTYSENVNTLGKRIIIRSVGPLDPDVVDATIINAQGSGTVVTCNTGEQIDTEIVGLTLQGGNAFNGGGLQCNGTNPTIRQCHFRNNTSDKGAGAHAFAGFPRFFQCKFTDNSATGLGGGIYIQDVTANTTVVECVFVNNTATVSGGGLHIQNVSGNTTSVVKCVFVNNTAPLGGGLANDSGNVDVNRCLIVDNHADDPSFARGGGIMNNGDVRAINSLIASNTSTSPIDGDGGGISNTGVLTLINTTIVNNIASFPGGGGGIFVEGGGTLTGHNSICWGGTPNEIDIFNSPDPTFTFSDLPGGPPPGPGNISEPPNFFDPDGLDNLPGTLDDDYRLGIGSPAIDAGNTSMVLVSMPTDADGLIRVVDDPFTADTGFGVPPRASNGPGVGPIVDMGAYEVQICPADGNGDRVVNLDDLQILLFSFGGVVAPFTNGDANGDGVVNLDDLQLLLFAFGMSCN